MNLKGNSLDIKYEVEDVCYSEKGFEPKQKNYISIYDTNQSIDMIIKALGTMVLFPDEVSDPVNIGKKIYRGTKQMPILLDKDRENAVNKLTELINKL